MAGARSSRTRGRNGRRRVLRGMRAGGEQDDDSWSDGLHDRVYLEGFTDNMHERANSRAWTDAAEDLARVAPRTLACQL